MEEASLLSTTHICRYTYDTSDKHGVDTQERIVYRSSELDRSPILETGHGGIEMESMNIPKIRDVRSMGRNHSRSDPRYYGRNEANHMMELGCCAAKMLGRSSGMSFHLINGCCSPESRYSP
ncbi:hypothetical protein Tco_1345434 [Tanacetum coccineum]